MPVILSALVFLSSISSIAFAQVPAVSSSMNGYSLKDFPDFEKKWKLVTVRYRRDTGELRFTYANPKAYDALIAGKSDYPDGAVFAKIGLMTEDDPSFTSSAVPSGARRYQLMVRHKAKHADTDGWGYALFDGIGKTFPEDPKTQTIACHACHKLVPERGYVFSRPMILGLGKSVDGLAHLKNDFQRLKFAEGTRTNLPPAAREFVPTTHRTISRLEGELTKFLFAGTLDEIRPVLAREAKRAGRPAALVSANNDLFSLVVPLMDEKCMDSGKSGIMMLAWMSNKAALAPGETQGRPIHTRFCFVD